MNRFIDIERHRFGVEPMCRVLEVSSSGYHARRTRPPSKRELEDRRLLELIRQIHTENYGVYGVRRMWKQLHRQGLRIGRCRVERLMKRAGLEGIHRRKRRFTTHGDPAAIRPADLVDRHFEADRPNQLWVADLTYVRTYEGFVYAAFILDVFSRRIVGWQLTDHLKTDLALDALEMAVWQRRISAPLIHHSDRGSQYTSFRYTTRLADVGITASVGSVADAYDNAWLKPSSPHSRRSSCTDAYSAPERRSSSRSSSGSTGTTSDVCTRRSVTFHRRSTRSVGIVRTKMPTLERSSWFGLYETRDSSA